MISTSRDAGFEVKEGDKASTGDKGKVVKTTTNSSTSWPKLKDPRIVRVCRAFGGKDRHSKVTTVRGLRDRRVRLSVPTAIQLYDLQERLGFNQPSKVVDWLLNEAKHEIDELPPLQFPPGSLGQNYYQLMESSTNHELNKHQGLDWNEDQVGLPQWYAGPNSMEKPKDIDDQKNEELLGTTDRRSGYVGSSSTDHSHLSGLVSNSSHPRWNPSSNFSISQMGSSHGFTTQVEDVHNMNFLSNTSLALPSGDHHRSGATQSYFPVVTNSTASAEFDPKQAINNFNFLSSNAPTLYSISQIPPIMRPFHLSMNMSPKLFLPQDNNNGDQDPLPTKRQL